MNRRVFVVLDCEPRSETNKDFFFPPDGSVLRRRTVPPRQDDFTDLLHPTLQTESSFFFVLKVENIMIELTIYIHTPYMLNTVNIISFLIFDFIVFFCFVTGDCTRIIFFKHYSAPTWTTSNAAERENKTSDRSRRNERSPRLFLERLRAFIFVFQPGFLWCRHSDMLLRYNAPSNTNATAVF